MSIALILLRFVTLKNGQFKVTQISLSFQVPWYFFSYLPKSSTRRKSGFLFVIETARAFTLVGETRWPAQGEPLFSFSKRASAKKCRFGRVLRNYHQSAGRGLWQSKRFDPGKCQKEIFGPAHRSSGGPAHQVVNSVGLTPLFLFVPPISIRSLEGEQRSAPAHFRNLVF